ncbi:MAG TPA: oligopeptide transporter, OPT family [Bacteroidota bacterium]|nr:oligopeptide transporter, OPT family [Bacteroidota bacterium]
MAETNQQSFQPFIPATQTMKEFTVKSIVLGALFGVLFGAATVYLGLRSGLTISASIPIAVIAISIGRKWLKTTILENNIIQTAGSAGESIAGGIAFTLPGFLFLTMTPGQTDYFTYWTILTMAIFGGLLGTLMMIPLRRSLIVKEHETLPYPEGTACASVLIAGEKGGDFAKRAYQGLGLAGVYAVLQLVFNVISALPTWVTKQTNRFLPSATINGSITPEYLGVGYIIGPKIAGVLVSGGVLAWLGLIPLLATLVPPHTIAEQLVKLGYLAGIATAGGPGGWDPATQTFADTATAVYRAYVRQIGAGAVAAGGFITLIKTLPTIVASFKASVASFKENKGGTVSVLRTEKDLSIITVIVGSIGLAVLMAFLPQVPGDSVLSKLLLGVLVIIFGFFFVTVSSRITGLIGTSSNPISGMTIATLMGTSLVFIAVGWTGSFYEPMALVVGSMICVAAANGGGTSQDLKTGYLVGATPRYQQISLFIGAIVSSLVIGATIKILDQPTAAMLAQGLKHAMGSDKFPAPQGTLMATLIRGLLSFNLDWQFVLVGAFLAITMELCNVNSLSFAVGAYLPLSTTLPIFVGGTIKGVSDWNMKRKGKEVEKGELSSGNLFATGLVAGGALLGVIVALLSVWSPTEGIINALNFGPAFEGLLGQTSYDVLGVLAYAAMGIALYRVSQKPMEG